MPLTSDSAANRSSDLMRGAASLGLAQLALLISNLATQVVAARALGPADFGRFSLLSLTSLIALVATASVFPQALRYIVSVRPDTLPSMRRWLFFAHLPLCALVSFGVYLAAPLLAGPLADSALDVGLKVIALEIFFRAGLLEGCLYLINGLGRHRFQGRLQILYAAVRGPAAVVLLLIWGLEGAAWGLALAGLSVGLISAAFTLSLKAGPPNESIARPALATSLLRSSGYGFLTFLLGSINLWIVQHNVDPASVGAYASAFLLTRPLLSIGFVVGSSLFARVAHLSAHGQFSEASALVMGWFDRLAIVFLPALVLAFGYGLDALHLLFGPSYELSNLAIGLLFLGTCAHAIQDFLAEILGALGRFVRRTMIAAAMLVVHAALVLTLLPTAGLPGAAAAQAMVGVGTAALCWLSLAQAINSHQAFATMMRIAGCCVPMIGFLLLVPKPRGTVGILAHGFLALLAFLITSFFFLRRSPLVPKDPTMLRVASNALGLPARLSEGIQLSVEVIPGNGRGAKSAWRFWIAAFRSDLVVVHIPDHLVVCSLGILRRLGLWPIRCRVIVVDTILTKPRDGSWPRFKHAIKRAVFGQADRYVFHLRAFELCETWYGISRQKCVYVPFCVTAWERIRQGISTSEEYVLSGGRSRRDYETFCRAMADLPFPGVIVVPSAEEASIHGTNFRNLAVPPNVRVVHDDGSIDSWLELISRARIVAVCVLPDTISASGVSTFMVAMALKKCVIVSESPATQGILTHENEAVLVPAGDSTALSQAIRRTWEDDAFRADVAARGYAYAEQIQGEAMLFERVLSAAVETAETKHYLKPAGTKY